MPGMGVRGANNRFHYVTNLPRGPPLSHESAYPVPSAGGAYALPLAVPTTFSMYASSAPPIQMPPPMVDPIRSPPSYSAQVSPISSQFTPGPSNQASPMQSMAGILQHDPQTTPAPLEGTYSPNFFDPNDPMQYHFDPASFNFGNHYGALEFGMLGHMSSSVVGTPPGDANGSLPTHGAGYTTPGAMPTGYHGSPVPAQTFMYPPDPNLGEWPNDAGSTMGQTSGPQAFPFTGPPQGPGAGMMDPDGPMAYTIGMSPSSLASLSASSSPPTMMVGMDDGAHPALLYPSNAAQPQAHDGAAPPRPVPSVISTPNLKAQMLPTQRTRDPSSIYDDVKQPYSYTAGFHGLTAFLQKRFSPQKTLRIAKALASIRPSFISCTKTLNREDLIFMEKCFQRTLFEYEDFINACGTPTIVCRRTGEVAAVGKEFSMLTGWSKEVLLGKEPNLNVNTGQPSSTPHGPGGVRPEATDDSRPQPVFLAELLDDDSVIGFYEDFARLAFGDSRGSVTTQCNLLKYKTAADYAAEADPHRRPRVPQPPYSSGAMGIHQLGDKDGKVECSYCWTVKRDVFDIPMLIVMNVSDTLSDMLLGYLHHADRNPSFYRVYEAKRLMIIPPIRSELFI